MELRYRYRPPRENGSPSWIERSRGPNRNVDGSWHDQEDPPQDVKVFAQVCQVFAQVCPFCCGAVVRKTLTVAMSNGATSWLLAPRDAGANGVFDISYVMRKWWYAWRWHVLHHVVQWHTTRGRAHCRIGDRVCGTRTCYHLLSTSASDRIRGTCTCCHLCNTSSCDALTCDREHRTSIISDLLLLPGPDG